MPNLNTPHNRPITLALLAMGGEGGGGAAEISDHGPTVVRSKRELGLGTLCHSKSRSLLDCNCLFGNSVMP